MRKIYIYLGIHLLCFLMLLLLGGAWLQPYMQQIGNKKYTEIVNQPISKITEITNFNSLECGVQPRGVVVTTSKHNIFAIFPVRGLWLTPQQRTIMAIEIRNISEQEEKSFTYAKAHYYADQLNLVLRGMNKTAVCIQALDRMPNELLVKDIKIQYFSLILTHEQKLALQNQGLLQAFLIDFVFAPIILIVFIFFEIMGFHVP